MRLTFIRRVDDSPSSDSLDSTNSMRSPTSVTEVDRATKCTHFDDPGAFLNDSKLRPVRVHTLSFNGSYTTGAGEVELWKPSLAAAISLALELTFSPDVRADAMSAIVSD